MSGLYGRVNARGFPSAVYAGMTGAGALESQGGPYDPSHGDTTDRATYGPQVLRGYEPEAPADPYIPVLEGAWGLGGAVLDPDRTPGGHAAPVPPWAGSYDGEEILATRAGSEAVHGADFGAGERLRTRYDVADTPMTAWSTTDTGQTSQQKVTGQIRSMGGHDALTGYGGGGSGPGGINPEAAARNRTPTLSEPQPFYYLDPAERAALWPQASGSFTPDDAIQGPGPWASGWDAGDVPPHDPSAYTAPPEPANLTAPLLAAQPSAGWR